MELNAAQGCKIDRVLWWSERSATVRAQTGSLIDPAGGIVLSGTRKLNTKGRIDSHTEEKMPSCSDRDL
jgi:hypothetical protein